MYDVSPACLQNEKDRIHAVTRMLTTVLPVKYQT